ncbi:mucin-5AC-like [Entelurus aequoreus]|uniref:mucin-5AC-like n=1 Tax=Entelurus aequoreus TaxID=161455 RepID=UPI002B1E1377|nr:mucin-5AC-like [Entelurus aequoreus]
MLMKSFFSGSSCTDLFTSFVRVKKTSSHWAKTFPLLLLAGLASCNQTSVTSPIVTSAVYYIVDIAVDVTGPTKNESEITSWLQQVFQNQLESCLFPNIGNNQTATPTTMPSTSANGTTTLSQNQSTNAATTNATQSNFSTTLQINTTAATTTLPSNTTTAATTTLPGNTTTAVTTTLPGNTTTAATTTLPSNTTTVATTTLPSNTTTVATTALPSNTTTVATTALPSNTTTVATTALPGNTTTAVTTALPGNTTIAATTAFPGNTTIAATTTLPSNITAVTTTMPVNQTTAIQNMTTGLTTIRNSTTATTIQSNTNIAATTIQNRTIAFNPTQNNTPTNPTIAQNNPITPSLLLQNNQVIIAIPSSLIIDTAAAATDGASRSMADEATANTPIPRGETAERLNLSARFVRDVIQSRQSSDLLQGVEVSCAIKTQIRTTNCLVTLALKQSVLPCCILQTLCTAGTNASGIHVVARRANRLTLLNHNCSSDQLEENICIYNSTNSTCDDSEFGAPPCGSNINNCSCLSYCNGTDAYYTFEISLKNTEMNISHLLSLISQLNQSCSPTDLFVYSVSCSSTIANEYKNATLDCGQAAANPQMCRGILHLAEEVAVCNVSAAITAVLKSQENITFDGRTTRAAFCGPSNSSENLLDSQLTWINTNLQHADFCTAEEGSSPFFFTQKCQVGKNVVVQLKEQCVPMASTTAGPNVTIDQPNTTSFPVNTTTPSNGTAANDAESQASALLELTNDVSRLNASQVDQLVSQLEALLSGPNVSLALANTSIHIVSNLLGATPEMLAQSSDRIIGIVETVGFKVVLEGESQTLLAPDLALSAQPVDGSNFQEVFFSISDPSDVQVRGDFGLRRNVRNDSSIPQGSVTLPPSLTQNLTFEEQQLVSRVHFNFYQKSTVFQDRSLGTRRLISGILGASVANITVTGLQDDVVIRLRNTQPIPANYVASCVFWDFALNEASGGWNTNGCRVQSSTDNLTVCGCNHLTSFAILLDLARQPLTSRVQATILTFITYIGCGISAIFLSFTLLTYLAFGKLRKDIPSKILIQLCLALLLLNLVFLVDAWLALYKDTLGLCISTAWFLHYFLLVAFTWMGLEAVHMYLAIVKVFNTHISRYMLKFSVAGWGIPMIVVIVVIAVDKDNYGQVSYGRYSDGTTDDFCWLRNDVAFYVAVVAYYCVIFLFNFTMLVVVLVQLCRMKRDNPHNSQHRTTGQDVRSVVGITFLLGLTWGFAFFAWGPVNLPFMYLFAICNSFQGFFIFVFHCAAKDTVRRQWRTYLCCGKLRLAENSEWSRTATQKTGKKMSVTRVPSLPSSTPSNSSSAFLSHNLEQTPGIGSPFDDAIITADEQPSTVILD